MKIFFNKILSFFFLVAVLVSCSQGEEQKQFTIAEYEAAAKHMDRALYGLVYNQVSRSKFVGENHLIYSTKNQDGTKFVLVDANAKTKKDAFDHKRLAEALSKEEKGEIDPNNLPIYAVSLSDDLSMLQFKSGGISYSCSLSDYTISKEEQSSTPRASRKEHVSPNGKLAAYIDNYNLWVRDLTTNKKTQLTFDGKEDYGYATNNAGWIKSDGAVLKWSPNSDKIATFQQDARGVGMMYLTSTNVGHPKLEAWKHPLPGDKTIFTIERVIIHLGAKPKTVRLKMNKDFQRGTTTDHIASWGNELLDSQWKEDGSQFAFVSVSRDHKVAHLQIADAYSGKVSSIHKEEVDTYYESGVDAENWRVLFDSNEFIWYSEKSNWGHMYLYDLTTKALKNPITSGDWIVHEITHIDKEKRQIYFIAGGKEEGNPYHSHYYRVDFDGSNLVHLTPSEGTHRVTPSKDYSLFVDVYSSTDKPPVAVLRNQNGEKIMDL